MRRPSCWRSPRIWPPGPKCWLTARSAPPALRAAAVGIDKLAAVGVLYNGLDILGGGSILTGLTLAAIATFIIEREFMKASAFAFAGAVMTYFGFMHGPAVGIGQHGLGVTPGVALAYLIVAVFLLALTKMPEFATAASPRAMPAE